ncbi:MAG: amidohydrolase family protein, partial [Desulfurococcales archaeon]|nr:amidohydrolase family protein [Desulfurococcales archaeon]
MTHYDLIIRGGYVIDGTGAPAFKADIGVVGDTVIKLGDLSGCPAGSVINAEGMYVCPGFIDIHNHSDLSIFKVPTADNYVLQGVTTIVIGNCGSSPAPVTEKNKELIRELMWGLEASSFPVMWSSFGEYLSKLDSLEKSINIAALVGHGTVRSAVLGAEDVKAGGRELKEMALLIEDAMKSGAFGMSLGLIYIPSMFADLNELMYLSKAVARYRGLLAVHMKDEGMGLIDSVIEVITIAKETGVKLEISHLKAVGRASWGKAATALRIIEEYASKGLD